MKKTLLITALFGGLLSTTAAFAGNRVDYDGGKITHMDRTSGSVTLADGNTFHDGAAWDFKRFHIGEKVHLSYDTDGGEVLTLMKG